MPVSIWAIIAICVYQAPFGTVLQLAGTGGHCVLMVFGSFVLDK